MGYYDAIEEKFATPNGEPFAIFCRNIAESKKWESAKELSKGILTKIADDLIKKAEDGESRLIITSSDPEYKKVFSYDDVGSCLRDILINTLEKESFSASFPSLGTDDAEFVISFAASP